MSLLATNMGDGMSLPYISDSRQDMLQSHKHLIRNVTMKAQSPQMSKQRVMVVVWTPHNNRPVCNLHQNSSNVSPAYTVKLSPMPRYFLLVCSW